jgi:hypothetical protein
MDWSLPGLFAQSSPLKSQDFPDAAVKPGHNGESFQAFESDH